MSHKKSGLVAALEYTGIPTSLLSKRPKLPSRNWLIFLSLTGSLISAYVYDRRQCKKLNQFYVQAVREEGQGFSWTNGGEAGKDSHLAWPRKLTVYGAKWPGDEDHDQGMRYFRRYIKPIFVAAAIDYDMITGKYHGDIANRVEDEIKQKRRESESQVEQHGKSSSHFWPNMPPSYYSPSSSSQEALALAGGSVIIGRATLKEYLAGVVRGYTEPYMVDGRRNWGEEAREERVRQALTDDIFDLDELPAAFQIPAPSVTRSTASPLPPIPPLPPLLLVPFIDYLGFAQIPYMLLDFFYKRRHVREGGEAALRAVWGATRSWEGPSTANEQSPSIAPSPPQGGDLDFALGTESYYRSYLLSPLSSPSPSEKSPLGSVQKARAKYYTELPARLWVAREFSRRSGSFEDESDANKLPPSEVELRLERFEKEKKWQAVEEAWEIVRPERGCLWDPRLEKEGVFKVFVGGGS
ncbi:hypothetical protein GYMLUDRAFT_219101 [Collybiopsis luxurians FD-317 M1]|nr:hypothetical protein GYMLUDRAFT_219101 [Collybiopsis luxurians FD-317 M1]